MLGFHNYRSAAARVTSHNVQCTRTDVIVALFWRETILPRYDGVDGDDDGDNGVDNDGDESAMRKDSRETRDATACERKEIHRSVANERLAQPVTAIKKNDVASLPDGYQNTGEKNRLRSFNVR